jgi:hypothetical protein
MAQKMKVPEFYFFEWIARVEHTISGAVSKCIPRNWNDEDYLTRSWMQAICDKVASVKIKGLGIPYAAAWDVLKLTGSAETSFGDIGVFVRIRYPNGVLLEGVSFVEAKRIYRSSGRYEMLDSNQLERMVNKTPFHRLALYSDKPISEAALGVAPSPHYWWYRENIYPCSNVLAAVLPTRIALAMKSNKPADLHPPCLPLSYQICARYLKGYDLDFASLSVQIVRDGGAGAPQYLLVADVVMGGETSPPSTDDIIHIGPDGPYASFEMPDSEHTIENEPAEHIKLTH